MEICNAHEQQEMSSHGLEELLIGCPRSLPPEKKPRPQPEQALKCPRCDSTNTKFCYYNNYSLSQPRYFCKGCRRYWTKGGSLRNVPVGGGCRKNRRSSSSSSPSPPPSSNSIISYNHGDLTLSFARQLWPSLSDHEQFFLGNPNPNSAGSAGGFLSLMRNGFLETSSMNGFHQICYGNNGSVEEEVQMPNGVDGGLGMEYSSWHGLVNTSLI